ncbi:hypothetical protein ACKE5C_19215 (plasmid) [Aneurinibacillus thermoaerophilus]|uniref:Uncharacterized protein n=1 Tax=Aneurinibacillus thermoaerophilus TaxID=143495 RepID=A0ABX8YG20_ANETH|nr:hypothetical protein [Aneurinibacillus thermoaerophilus]QYY44763.1 hypothetical protein K3F53_19160 [Aneurinibacillus thermoaerophilus]
MFEFLARIKSILWLHRKCGGLLYGETIIGSPGSYNYASSSIRMRRQRNNLPGTGQATVGTEETEYEE